MGQALAGTAAGPLAVTFQLPLAAQNAGDALRLGRRSSVAVAVVAVRVGGGMLGQVVEVEAFVATVGRGHGDAGLRTRVEGSSGGLGAGLDGGLEGHWTRQPRKAIHGGSEERGGRSGA